jgi:hypothetical protein
MNLDNLLNEASPKPELSDGARSELHALVDSKSPRGIRRKHRITIGIVATTALLLAGGVGAATAATVLQHPTWYDAASDWTTQVKTVKRVFAVNGQRYNCVDDISVQSKYNGKGTAEFQQALKYLQGFNVLSIQPDPDELKSLQDANWSPPPSPARINQMAWIFALNDSLRTHMMSMRLDPTKVSMGLSEKCDF